LVPVLVELRCTNCNALMDVAQGRVVRCRFCGASFIVQEPASGEQKITYVVSLDRVGPSNRARVAEIVARHVGLAQGDAETLVARAPCEVVVWDDYARAKALSRDIEAGGAAAAVTERVVETPAQQMLPAATVILEAVGENKLVVTKLVHDHIGLGLADAKRLVESAPCALGGALEGGRATAFRDALIRAGARARTT
jgi:large subunit ribosomal protein L7/L12